MNAIIVTWMLSLAMPAGAPHSPDNPDNTGTRSNQAISLEDDAAAYSAVNAEPTLPGESETDQIEQSMANPGGAEEAAKPHESAEAASDAALRVATIGARVIPRSARSDSKETTAAKAEVGPVPWYRDTFVSLAIVLALIGAAYFAVRRWMPSGRVTEDRLLQIVARAVVSPKHQVVLLNLGHRFELVGVSADRIHPVSSITEPAEVADLVARLRSAGGSGPRFDDLLRQEARSLQDPVEEPVSPAGGRQAGEARTQVSALLSKLKTMQTARK